MIFVFLFFLVLAPAIVWLFLRMEEHRTYWRRRGIPGPEPKFLVGNAFEVTQPDTPAPLRYVEWTKKFGKTYGIIDGSQKVLITSDTKILQDVFVNKFDHFHARRGNFLAGDSDKAELINVFQARGARWKRLRAISSPSFSVNSLKKVMPTVVDSIHTMVNEMERQFSKSEQPFNIHPFYQELTIDVISRIALGQKGSSMFHNPYISAVKELFDRSPRAPLIMLGRVLPTQLQPLVRLILRLLSNRQIRLIALKAPLVRMQPIRQLQKQMENAVHERKKKKEEGEDKDKSIDFIDLFLDAEADIDPSNTGGFDMKTHTKVERRLTEKEIRANLFLFLLAGYDTTANSLAYATFYIAKHDEVRRRLQEEIDFVCGDGAISYEQVHSLRYMENVVREALRLHPLAAQANSRTCMEETRVGETGLLIEKGTRVVSDTFSIHYSREIWGDDAAEFNPDRGEQHEAVHWLPFGIGPRVCLGMRLALLEEKLALAHLLRRFDVFACADSENQLVCRGALTISPDSVTVAIRPRLA